MVRQSISARGLDTLLVRQEQDRAAASADCDRFDRRVSFSPDNDRQRSADLREDHRLRRRLLVVANKRDHRNARRDGWDVREIQIDSSANFL